MPVSLELKYEYLFTWGGRLKIIEIILAILAISCCAPAYYSTQHWFLLVAATCLLGTLFFLLFHTCLDVFLKGTSINWVQTEFWFTVLATFLYFTAFIAQLVEFSGYIVPGFQYWVDSQVAAGVFGLFNDVVYGVATYFLYLDWKASPMMTTPAPGV